MPDYVAPPPEYLPPPDDVPPPEAYEPHQPAPEPPRKTPCPLCGAEILSGNGGFACSRWREGCAFKIPRAEAADHAALKAAIADGRWAAIIGMNATM